jgi:hypothetical protein
LIKDVSEAIYAHHDKAIVLKSEDSGASKSENIKAITAEIPRLENEWK